VHELDGANPSKMLLAAIHKMSSKPDKEDEFFLGVLHDGHINAVHNIISGDPSRGTMALEADIAPSAGSLVQVCLYSYVLAIYYEPKYVYRSSISHRTHVFHFFLREVLLEAERIYLSLRHLAMAR
jgi:hypothetical protein